MTDFARVLPGDGLQTLAPGGRASLTLDAAGRCANSRSVSVAFLGLSRGNAIRVRLPAGIDAATCEQAMRTSPIVAVR